MCNWRPRENQIKTVTIVDSKDPVIKKHSVDKVLSRKEIQKLNARSVTDVAAVSANVFQASEGGALNIKGARSDGTVYYIDGVKVTGGLGLNKDAIDQTVALTSGLPAAYGDATGGVISVTTRGPSGHTTFGAEGLSSTLLDPYNYNLGAFNVSGPIIVKNKGMKDANGASIERPLLGYYVGLEGEFQPEPFTSPVQLYKVKDDVLAKLRAQPLRPSALGVGFQSSALYITKNDLEKVKTFKNDEDNSYRLSFKLDFQASKRTRFTLGGRYVRDDYRNFDLRNYLYNSDKNGKTVGNTIAVWGRFQQTFANSTDTNGTHLANVRYSIQVDYSRYLQNTFDPTLKDNIFGYGYVGQYDLKKAPVFEYKTVKLAGLGNVTAYHQIAFQDTAVSFTPGTQNPLLANYTSTLFDYVGNDPNQRPRTLSGIQAQQRRAERRCARLCVLALL